MSWETISPDLTLNDPARQKQDDSSGLTIDATQAENHNSILTIASSPLQQGVIWVGTDDGNVQLTKDGGKTWTNLSSRIPGLPKEAWIAQITASRCKAGEAFVVSNLYRMGSDLAPYIYRTSDFGQTWTRIMSEKEAKGYTLCFIQDPVEPRLMFAGTEHGLWVSIDEGKTWTQWDSGIPAATPTMDLAIQEREADLAIATFGRSIYVLDNIRPLRKLAATSKVLDQSLVAFDPSTAYLAVYRGPQGYGKDAEGLYQAPNRPAGASLPVYLKPKQKAAVQKPVEPAELAKKSKKLTVATKPDESNAIVAAPVATTIASRVKADSLLVQIYDEANKLVRTMKQAPDTALGMQRIVWDLTETAIRMPSSGGGRRGGGEPTGNPVMPGRYKVLFAYAGAKDSTFLTVDSDPRVPFDKEAALARKALQDRLNKNSRQLTEITNRIQEANDAAEGVKNRLKEKKGADVDELRKFTITIQDSLKKAREGIVGKRAEQQGSGNVYMNTPISKIQEASSYINRRTEKPTKTENQLVDQAEVLSRETVTKVNQFFSKQWAEYYKKVQATPLDPLKEYPPIGSTP